MDRDRGDPKRAGTDKTHIHDLPDECLIEVLNRVHVSNCLPSSIHNHAATVHPLQCALVCKRWHPISDAAVRDLHLVPPRRPPPHALLQKLVERFPNLATLSTPKGLGGHGLLLLADSTPQLKQLTLGSQPPIPAMTQALAKWTSLTRLHLDDVSFDADVRTMFRVISKLPSLLHLGFVYYGHDLRTVCTHLRAMSSLATLDIKSSQFPKVSSETVPWVKVLRKLSLKTFIDDLPSSLGFFENLEVLSLYRAMLLRTLPESIGSLSHLMRVELVYCWDLASLPSSLGMVTGLKILTVVGCPRLEALPVSLRNLASLESCTLMKLGLHALPEGVSEWRTLTRLTVKDCKSLQELPRGLGQMYALKELSLSGCSSDFEAFTELPETLEELNGLRVLEVDQALALKLPESLKCRSSLEIRSYDPSHGTANFIF